MAWWRLQIPSDAMQRQSAAFDSFERAFVATGAPSNAALLSRACAGGVEYIAADGDHPAIGSALRAVGFTKTSRPTSAEGVSLLIGLDGALDRLIRS